MFSLFQVEQGQLPPSISVSYECTLVYRSTKFTLQCTYAGPGTVCVSLNNSSTTVHIRRIVSVGAGGSGSEQRDGGFLVRGGVDGKSRKVYYKEDNTGLRVSFDGITYTFTKESDPTQVLVYVCLYLYMYLRLHSDVKMLLHLVCGSRSDYAE